MTAEQARLFVHDVLLGMLRKESHTTRSVLAAVPNANLDYRPDPHAKTANELLRHIATTDPLFLKSVVDGAFVPGSVKVPEDLITPQQVAEWYEKEHACCSPQRQYGEVQAITSQRKVPAWREPKE